MADALVSPAVGGTVWAASAGLVGWCARHVRRAGDDRLVPMMGVMGAFVFAAQMINFAIPGTGSSGHVGGGLLLAILLGPHAAFLVIASIMTVQALFFADGGLLALGCNIFNLGFFPAFVAYPFLYRPIAGGSRTGSRAWTASIISAVVGLQLGSFGVVMETTLSRIAALPFSTFLVVMQPIHLAIGVVEGLATVAVIEFVARTRPEALAPPGHEIGRADIVPFLTAFLLATAFLGLALSQFASARPDGLEWSIGKIIRGDKLERPAGATHGAADALQQKLAVLPDYNLKKEAHASSGRPAREETSSNGRWGTSFSAMAGGFATLLCAGVLGYVLRRAGRSSPRSRSLVVPVPPSSTETPKGAD